MKMNKPRCELFLVAYALPHGQMEVLSGIEAAASVFSDQGCGYKHGDAVELAHYWDDCKPAFLIRQHSAVQKRELDSDEAPFWAVPQDPEEPARGDEWFATATDITPEYTITLGSFSGYRVNALENLRRLHSYALEIVRGECALRLGAFSFHDRY